MIQIRRIERPDLQACFEISQAVYGNDELTNFTEEFIPLVGQVPAPKAPNFAHFLNFGAKEVWSVIEAENNAKEVCVGFVLMADMPHSNSIGFGINKHFARRGIMKPALEEVLNAIETTGRNQPIFAHTSIDNLPAQRLLEGTGFQFQREVIDMMGRHFRYVK
jgi:RimJ/RimL family protein N-acetyltransferase